MTYYRVVSDADGGKTALNVGCNSPEEAIREFARTALHLKTPTLVHAHGDDGNTTVALVTPAYRIEVATTPKKAAAKPLVVLDRSEKKRERVSKARAKKAAAK